MQSIPEGATYYSVEVGYRPYAENGGFGVEMIYRGEEQRGLLLSTSTMAVAGSWLWRLAEITDGKPIFPHLYWQGHPRHASQVGPPYFLPGTTMALTDVLSRLGAVNASSTSDKPKWPVTRASRSTLPVATRSIAVGQVLA
ncbi:hypothetical protein BH23ACT6_BH23ACT6_10990 [soil metagenome]